MIIMYNLSENTENHWVVRIVYNLYYLPNNAFRINKGLLKNFSKNIRIIVFRRFDVSDISVTSNNDVRNIETSENYNSYNVFF